MTHLAWAGFAGLLITGCAFDSKRFDRPARLQLGASTRSFSTPPTSNVALRETQPDAATERHGAGAATIQFTMEANELLYAGGELEAGALATRGSSYGGAYAIGGLQHRLGIGVIGAELAAGYRTMRASTTTDNVDSIVTEPRVRGQLWINPQVSFGAVAGATLGEHPVWMAGLYLGIHSNPR